MSKYYIIKDSALTDRKKDNSSEKSNSSFVTAYEAACATIKTWGLFTSVPAFFSGIVLGVTLNQVDKVIKNNHEKKDNIYIEDAETLSKYRCLPPMEWKSQRRYKEHPLRKNVLILRRDFNNVVRHDMIADILNYILEHFLVENVIIGIVDENSSSIEGAVSVSEISPKARMNCKLSKQYYTSISNSREKPSKTDHYWIDSTLDFCDLKAAVKSRAREFEYTVKISTEKAFELGIADEADIKGKKKKDYQIYIRYTVSD